MFTNKLNANGGGEKKMYTQKEKKNTRCTIFVEKKNIIEFMNIALIVHFTPQNPEGGQGRGPCSVKAVRWREAKRRDE